MLWLAVFLMVSLMRWLMVKISSSGSMNTFTGVSSGVPSARFFSITKLTQKWLRS